MNDFTRRNFIKKTSALGAGIMLGAGLKAGSSEASDKNYGDEYILRGRETMEAVRATEVEKIERAAAMAASALAAGKKIYSEVTIGHMMHIETADDRIGNPALFRTLPGWASNPAEEYLKMQAGDFFITNYPVQHCMDAHNRGVKVVGVTSPFIPDEESGDSINPWAEGYFISHVSDLIIDSKTPHSEGIVDVTEIPAVPLFPGSALTLTLIYWMLNAELADKIAQDHASKPMEKALEYYNIAMERYNEAALQIGEIKQAGVIAAERILNGAKFYIYDKHNALTSEACGRASGLMLSNGINADLANLKYGDILVMGMNSSNDPQDIKVAQKAKKLGAWVVGIGPKGTDGITSGERTLQFVDVPLDNRSGDSWGCIGIKGRTKKICPTGGITNAMLFWAFQAQMVAEMVKRGEVPYIWMGFHIKEGRDYDNAMRPLFLKRGY